MTPTRILCIVGTRPELIKMAPVVLALRADPRFRATVLASGQHRDLLAPLAQWFGIAFDQDLGVMVEGQSLTGLTSRLMLAFEAHFGRERPDLVVGQGDTTTVLCAALSAFYLGIPFAHVEAGLRTGDLTQPFPEEFNRVAADRLARFHFCPTERAARDLRAEGAAGDSVHVTGNTVIDALRYTTARLERDPQPHRRHDVLLTAHRRENFGQPLQNILRAVRRLLDEHPKLTVLYPVHPNPNVRGAAQALLGGHERVTLSQPLDYPALVQAMQDARFILTDSGGIQEEAPALGKPVLVLRHATERPEVIDEGVAELVGADEEAILSASRRLLTDAQHHARMSRVVLPYGDGHAAERIRDVLARA